MSPLLSPFARSRTRPCGSRLARRGVATVEFALLAPIFFMIIIGLIEIGRAIMVQEALTNASREGARVAGNDATMSASTVQAAVDGCLSNASISGATTTTSPLPLSSVANGSPVTVTVSIPYGQVSWVPSSWFFKGQSLKAKSVMIRQPSP